MEIVIPILGLRDRRNDLSDILVLEQFGMKEIAKVDYNYLGFPTITNEISDLLHVISCIFYKKAGVCLEANFEFPSVTDPEVFEGQQELSSIGLGLIVKLFYDYGKQNARPGSESYDILCVSGILDKNPDKKSILKGDFLSDTTGKIKEKLVSFLDYVKKNELSGKRCAFVYCGREEEEALAEVARRYGLAGVAIKKYSNFDTLSDSISGGVSDKKTESSGLKQKLQPRTLIASGIVVLSVLILAVALPLFLGQAQSNPLLTEAPKKAKPGWAEEAIMKECRYIKDCSWTEYAANNSAVAAESDSYGCFNNIRIGGKGPDWVIPEGGAVGAVGLMRGVIELKARGYDIKEFDQVLRKFFWNWATGKARDKAQCEAGRNPDDGAWAVEVIYSGTGQYRGIKEWNSGTTAYMLIAMWKYYEYNLEMGQAVTAADWLEHAWPGVKRAADFLCRMYNPAYKLVQSHGGNADMWTGDSSVACAALRCADRWASVGNKKKKYDYLGYANNIADGLRAMADPGEWKNFYRVRRTDGTKEYVESIDQICFMPFETDALSPTDMNNYAKQLSDWWTYPGTDASFRMTFQTDNPGDWRYWGTHGKHFFSDNVENRRLHPGHGFRLAKVEWKHGNATGNTVYMERAAKRLAWGSNPEYSGLWFGAGDKSEAGVYNGFVNWRDENDYQKSDSPGVRIIDTSSYFIQLCAMVYYRVDTKFTPVR
jgi:hypothetical protein